MARQSITVAPPHLNIRMDALPFWKAIIAARARDTWNDIDLAQAANLAHCFADVERLHAELQKEGALVGLKISKKFYLREKLIRRSMALSRALHITPTYHPQPKGKQ